MVNAKRLPGIRRLSGAYTIWSVPVVPRAPAEAQFWAAVRCRADCTVVCDSDCRPAGATAAEGPYAAYELHGPLDFGLVGVLAFFTTVLAEGGIPVYTVSSYETDFLFIRADLAAGAEELWKRAGVRVDADCSAARKAPEDQERKSGSELRTGAEAAGEEHMSEDLTKKEAFVKEELSETQPGDYETSSDIMHNKVVGDRDTNGISAGMERLGDLSGVQYDEDMDEISVKIHKGDD